MRQSIDGQLACFDVVISTEAAHSCVHLRGELDLATAPHLDRLLDQLRRDGHRQITLDLSGLEFLSVAGLTVFLRADEDLRAVGGRLVLTQPTRMVRRVLAITGLDATLSMVDTACVLAAVWCRSVGASWTLELYEVGPRGKLGTIIDWFPSGVPIFQPEPEELAREMLAQRGLELFHDSSAGPGAHNRRGIGYACSDAELIRLAHLVRDDAAETGAHPVTLATQWIMAGFSADAAAGWIREGIHSPQAAQQQVLHPDPEALLRDKRADATG